MLITNNSDQMLQVAQMCIRDRFIPDYRINLLAPREITDFTGFRTSIRQDVYKRQT